MLTRRNNSSRGFTAVELVLVIVVLAIVVSVTMWQVDKRRQARLRDESKQNLTRQFTASYVMVPSAKNDHVRYNRWPQLSSMTGNLAPEPTEEWMNGTGSTTWWMIDGTQADQLPYNGYLSLISPAHCAGHLASTLVYQTMPEEFVQNMVGTRITLDSKI